MNYCDLTSKILDKLGRPVQVELDKEYVTIKVEIDDGVGVMLHLPSNNIYPYGSAKDHQISTLCSIMRTIKSIMEEM